MYYKINFIFEIKHLSTFKSNKSKNIRDLIFTLHSNRITTTLSVHINQSCNNQDLLEKTARLLVEDLHHN